jgi:A1 cistron-splicing factor AAR2
MDPWTAEHVFQHGAICIVEQAPVGMEFGIDLNCWRLADRFKGIKMVPPGFHCIYYGWCSGPRSGMAFYAHSKEVVLHDSKLAS